MTIESLIAEITSGGFTQYEEAGLIDHISLRTWIRNELKRFGSNLTQRDEVLIHIKEGKAKLPFEFWNLYLAVQCEIKGYESNDPKKVLQNSFFYKERVEGLAEWNNESESFSETTHKYVREDFYFQGAKATFHYGNPRILRLTKGMNRSICSRLSPNLNKALNYDNPNEISIRGDYVYANFKEGTVFLIYDGLPVDEEGQLLIPTTQHNRLQEYLIYYCRKRILEDLIMGDDDPSKMNMFNYYRGEADKAFGLAQTEIKMEALAGSDWKRKLRNKMRAQTLKYDLMLPNK